MKAQSDLASDRKSAAEMAAPAVRRVTIWIGSNDMTDFTSMIGKFDIPTTDELKQLCLTMKDLGSYAVPDINTQEVNLLPPLAVMLLPQLR